MTIYPGVRVVMECSPGGPPPATGANPWKAEIDFGHVLHATGTGGVRIPTMSPADSEMMSPGVPR
jgi:hypothetical protein